MTFLRVGSRYRAVGPKSDPTVVDITGFDPERSLYTHEKIPRAWTQVIHSNAADFWREIDAQGNLVLRTNWSQELKVWDVESWATLRTDSSKAVRVAIRLVEEPTGSDLAEIRAQVTGLFRRKYQEWADSLGERVAERTISNPEPKTEAQGPSAP